MQQMLTFYSTSEREPSRMGEVGILDQYEKDFFKT